MAQEENTDPADLCKWLEKSGFGPVTGVPDSTLASLQARILAGADGLTYYAATSEGEAMGIAAGWALAGRKPVVMMQNSGLGNAVNPLTSLHQVFRLPALIVVGWRGAPDQGPDAVEHAVMGRLTLALLDTLQVPCRVLDPAAGGMEETLDGLRSEMLSSMAPVALVVPRGRLAGDERVTGQEEPPVGPRGEASGCALEKAGGGSLGLRGALEALLAGVGEDALIVATTGFVSRVLYEISDSPNHFYMVGSMGCASAIGFGLATERPGRRVVVLDGDGAALMKLGTMATIGHYRPANLVHVILDNGRYASTGGQNSVSGTVDFGALGRAVGYEWSESAARPDEIARSCGDAAEGPGLLHIRISGADTPSKRPHHDPVDLRDRFMSAVGPDERRTAP